MAKGPLELVKCKDKDQSTCGLLQMRHSYDMKELYGDHYGYRSSLNQSMVDHLRDIVGKILKIVRVGPQDIVLDIGSNDGTLLKAYPQGKARRVGMDASGNKFKKYYPSDIELVSAFFSAVEFKKHFGVQKAKVVRRYFDRISLGPFYCREKTPAEGRG